ncbi:MAG: nucleotidyltransferase [Planctomycetes bacterium]|nr:nucleotidyltransferase [Planctomycetota bacterium]
MKGGFADLLERLADAKVEFVIVGGYAGIVHGCTYMTQDVDICCDFAPANLLALQRALSDLHPVHRMTPGRVPLELTAANVGEFQNLYLDTDLGHLDCLSEIQGVGGYEQVKQASVAIEVEGRELRVLSLDALIIAKEAMNRRRDKEAVRQLKAVRRLRQEGTSGGP